MISLFTSLMCHKECHKTSRERFLNEVSRIWINTDLEVKNFFKGKLSREVSLVGNCQHKIRSRPFSRFFPAKEWDLQIVVHNGQMPEWGLHVVSFTDGCILSTYESLMETLHLPWDFHHNLLTAQGDRLSYCVHQVDSLVHSSTC